MFKQQELNEIKDLAIKAWREAGARTKMVRFKWRNRRFISVTTSFRIFIDPDTAAWRNRKNKNMHFIAVWH